MKTYFAFASAFAFGVACGGQTVGDLDGGTGDSSTQPDAPIFKEAGGATCSSTEPCAQGTECGYLESQGCAATAGQCFLGGALCNSFSPGCACDGTIINVACTGLPPGYSTAPLLHTGECDAGK